MGTSHFGLDIPVIVLGSGQINIALNLLAKPYVCGFISFEGGEIIDSEGRSIPIFSSSAAPEKVDLTDGLASIRIRMPDYGIRKRGVGFNLNLVFNDLDNDEQVKFFYSVLGNNRVTHIGTEVSEIDYDEGYQDDEEEEENSYLKDFSVSVNKPDEDDGDDLFSLLRGRITASDSDDTEEDLDDSTDDEDETDEDDSNDDEYISSLIAENARLTAENSILKMTVKTLTDSRNKYQQMLKSIQEVLASGLDDDDEVSHI